MSRHFPAIELSEHFERLFGCANARLCEGAETRVVHHLLQEVTHGDHVGLPRLDKLVINILVIVVATAVLFRRRGDQEHERELDRDAVAVLGIPARVVRHVVSGGGQLVVGRIKSLKETQAR